MKMTFKLPDTGVLAYQGLCLVAVLGVFLVRSPRTPYLVNLLMLTIGIGAIASVMRIGPILYLGVLTFSILMEGAAPGMRVVPGRASDIALSLAVLAFVAGHYRLQSLHHAILPVDKRRLTVTDRPKVERPVRSVRLVTLNEVGTLVLTLPIAALAAQVAWLWLARDRQLLGIPPEVSRFLMLLWFLGIVLIITATVLAHWRRRQYDGLAADMVLQDVLWRETRREQRYINRWYGYGSMRGREQAEERRLWRKNTADK